MFLFLHPFLTHARHSLCNLGGIQGLQELELKLRADHTCVPVDQLWPNPDATAKTFEGNDFFGLGVEYTFILKVVKLVDSGVFQALWMKRCAGRRLKLDDMTNFFEEVLDEWTELHAKLKDGSIKFQELDTHFGHVDDDNFNAQLFLLCETVDDPVSVFRCGAVCVMY